MDMRRLRLARVALFKIKNALWLLTHLKLARLWTYAYTTLFTRDSGLALLDPLYRRFPSLAPFPREIEIEVTTRCHLKCTICEHTYWEKDKSNRNMTFEQFKHVLDQFPRLKWCGLTGIGTGFLNRDYLEMLRYAKSRNIFVEFFDSFHLMDEGIIREVVGMGIDKIWVSIEAATRETYEKIRVGSDWDKVLQNIRTLFRVKKEKKTPFPEVWFHFIINRYNLGEMEAYVDRVKDLAGDTRRNPVVIYWTNLLAFKEVEHLMVTVPPDQKKRVIQKCRSCGIFPIFNENVTRNKPVSHCTKWTEPFVLVSGHCQSCCAVNEVNDRDFQEEHAFGNLFDMDYSEIFDSEKFRRFKALLRQNKVPIACKNCRLYAFEEDQIVDRYWTAESGPPADTHGKGMGRCGESGGRKKREPAKANV